MSTEKDKEFLQLEAQLKVLERKCELDQKRFQTYKLRMNDHADELRHSKRKIVQEKEFMRYTQQRNNDEQDEFMENAYKQTLSQNIQLRDRLNFTNEKLNEETRALKTTKKEFTDYVNHTVENQALLVDQTKILREENERLQFQMAAVVRIQQAESVAVERSVRRSDLKGSQSLDEKPKKIEKESRKKKKKSKKEGQKKKRKEQEKEVKPSPAPEMKVNKPSSTKTQNARTNTRGIGFTDDEKMTPLASPVKDQGFAADLFPQLNNIMEEKLKSELYCPSYDNCFDDGFIIESIIDVRDSYSSNDVWRTKFDGL